MIQTNKEDAFLPLIKENSVEESLITGPDSCLKKENEITREEKELTQNIEEDLKENNNNFDNIENFENTLETRRWFILLMFFSFSFMYGAGWGTYSAIVDLTKNYYGISSEQVLWFTWQSNFVTLIFSFIGSNLLEKSLSISMILGCSVITGGAWIRVLCHKNYGWALFGQILLSSSSSIANPAPNKIANTWFHAKERFFVICLGSFASSLGTGVGYVFSPLIAAGKNDSEMENLLFIVAIMMSVPLILCFLVIRNKPKHSPNVAAVIKRNMSLLQSLKLLTKNRKYMLSMFSFGLIYSNCWSLYGLIGVSLSDLNVSNDMIGYIGLAFVVIGMIGSFAGTFFLKYIPNSRKYFDPIIKLLIFLAGISFLVVSIAIPLKANLTILIIALLVLGFGALGLIPFECIALEEIAYPVPESLSVTGMFVASALLGYPISQISTLTVFGKYGLFTLTITTMPFVIYILFFYRTSFNKSDKEKKNSSFHQNAVASFGRGLNDEETEN